MAVASGVLSQPAEGEAAPPTQQLGQRAVPRTADSLSWGGGGRGVLKHRERSHQECCLPDWRKQENMHQQGPRQGSWCCCLEDHMLIQTGAVFYRDELSKPSGLTRCKLTSGLHHCPMQPGWSSRLEEREPERYVRSLERQCQTEFRDSCFPLARPEPHRDIVFLRPKKEVMWPFSVVISQCTLTIVPFSFSCSWLTDFFSFPRRRMMVHHQS